MFSRWVGGNRVYTELCEYDGKMRVMPFVVLANVMRNTSQVSVNNISRRDSKVTFAVNGSENIEKEMFKVYG